MNFKCYLINDILGHPVSEFFRQIKSTNMLLINIKWFLKSFYRAHRIKHNFRRETRYLTEFVLGSTGGLNWPIS